MDEWWGKQFWAWWVPFLDRELGREVHNPCEVCGWPHLFENPHAERPEPEPMADPPDFVEERMMMARHHATLSQHIRALSFDEFIALLRKLYPCGMERLSDADWISNFSTGKEHGLSLQLKSHPTFTREEAAQMGIDPDAWEATHVAGSSTLPLQSFDPFGDDKEQIIRKADDDERLERRLCRFLGRPTRAEEVCVAACNSANAAKVACWVTGLAAAANIVATIIAAL